MFFFVKYGSIRIKIHTTSLSLTIEDLDIVRFHFFFVAAVSIIGNKITVLHKI